MINKLFSIVVSSVAVVFAQYASITISIPPSTYYAHIGPIYYDTNTTPGIHYGEISRYINVQDTVYVGTPLTVMYPVGTHLGGYVYFGYISNGIPIGQYSADWTVIAGTNVKWVIPFEPTGTINNKTITATNFHKNPSQFNLSGRILRGKSEYEKVLDMRHVLSR
jgi:hypothetical protein